MVHEIEANPKGLKQYLGGAVGHVTHQVLEQAAIGFGAAFAGALLIIWLLTYAALALLKSR